MELESSDPRRCLLMHDMRVSRIRRISPRMDVSSTAVQVAGIGTHITWFIPLGFFTAFYSYNPPRLVLSSVFLCGTRISLILTSSLFISRPSQQYWLLRCDVTLVRPTTDVGVSGRCEHGMFHFAFPLITIPPFWRWHSHGYLYTNNKKVN